MANANYDGIQGVSIKGTLEDIKKFVLWCKNRYPNLAGFNVYPSRYKGKSYIIAKCSDSPKPVHVLPIFMDYVNPLERPLIANAIHEAIHGYELTTKELEDEMVCKVNQ